MPARLDSPTVEMFDYIARDIPLPRRVIVANRWLSEPWLIARLERTPATNAVIRTTTAPTIIRGGVKPNILPSEAWAVVDFRIVPGDTVKDVIEHVRATVNDSNVTIRQVGSESSEPSPVSDINSASFAALSKTIHQVYPDAVVAPGLVIGRTDSRRYVRLADNSYRFLPMRLHREDLERIHGTDERIAIDNYVEIIHFYVQLLLNAAVR